MKVKCFISGPYSQGNINENVRNAMMTFDRLVDAGLAPFIPHLYHYQDIMSPRDYNTWLSLTIEWINVCNCLIRLPGDSAGADLEVEIAKQHGLRIYHHLHDCIAAESIPAITYDCEGGGP